MKVKTKFDALEMMIDAYKNLIERTEEFKNWFVDNFYGESMKLNTFVKDILKLCEKRENSYAKSMVSLLEMFNSYSLIKPICEENNYNFHEYFEHNEGVKVNKCVDNLLEDMNQFKNFIQVWDTKNTHKNNLLKEKEGILN